MGKEGLITAVSTLVVLVVTQFINIRSGRKREEQIESAKQQIAEVHVLVNSRLSKALQEIADLRDFISKQVHTGTVPAPVSPQVEPTSAKDVPPEVPPLVSFTP